MLSQSILFFFFLVLACCSRTDADFSQVKKTSIFHECAKAPSVPEDRRAPNAKDTLTVGTWNVRFLFLKNLGTGCPGRQCPWETFAEAEAHKNRLPEIGPLADILVVQENQDCDTLIWYIRQIFEITGDNSFRAYLIRGTDVRTGQNVGIISRVDPMEDLKRIDYVDYTDERRTEISKNVVFRFKLDNYPVPFTLIGLHLVGSPGFYSRDRKRERQASLVPEYVHNEVHPNDRLIILGDINDMSEKCPHAANSTTSSIVFSTLTSIERNGAPLAEAACIVKQKYRYTTFFKVKNANGEKKRLYQSLDHILMDSELFHKVKYVHFGWDKFVEDDVQVSDHYPLIVQFQLTEKKRKPRSYQRKFRTNYYSP